MGAGRAWRAACGACLGAPFGVDHFGVTSSGKGESMSDKKRLLMAILCFFFGVFGVHRFYAGKIGTGILQLVTLGGLGIWALVDFLMILSGAFTDKEGKKITEWT